MLFFGPCGAAVSGGVLVPTTGLIEPHDDGVTSLVSNPAMLMSQFL